MKKEKKETTEFTQEDLKAMTLEQLEELEAKVILECDEVNEIAGKKVIKLPESTDEEYAVVKEAIQYFFDKKTVNWQYAMYMIPVIEFWDVKQTEIPFPILDQILITLGEMSYTGYDEFVKISKVTNYFAPINDEYREIKMAAWKAAEKHNMILQAMDEKHQQAAKNK